MIFDSKTDFTSNRAFLGQYFPKTAEKIQFMVDAKENINRKMLQSSYYTSPFSLIFPNEISSKKSSIQTFEK